MDALKYLIFNFARKLPNKALIFVMLFFGYGILYQFKYTQLHSLYKYKVKETDCKRALIFKLSCKL